MNSIQRMTFPLALALAAGCTNESAPAKPAPVGPRDIVIAAQANVHGDIEPCG